MSPPTLSFISDQPVQRMFSATRPAIRESSTIQRVTITSATPTSTPPEV